MSIRKIQLDWKGYFDYTTSNTQKVPARPGVYKISAKQTDNTLKVRYIGQTDDLNRRLIQHLDVDNEQNECLAEKIKNYQVQFSFAEVGTQNDRDGAEKALYNHYKPYCNDPKVIPNFPDIEINFTN